MSASGVKPFLKETLHLPRRKKEGSRFPCGKLKSERFPPALVRQMVDAGRAKIINGAFGTAIGKLRLEGILTDTQVAAAHHFGRFIGHYDQLVGNPSRTVKSPEYVLGRAGMGATYESGPSCDKDCDCPRCEARKRASADYDKIRRALPNTEWSIVYHSVLLNEACPWPYRAALISGLDILADLFGYAAPGKRVAA